MEIIGVPESPNENCAEIVENIADKLGVKLSITKDFYMFSKILNKSKKIIGKIDSIENKKKVKENMKSKKTNVNNLNLN